MRSIAENGGNFHVDSNLWKCYKVQIFVALLQLIFIYHLEPFFKDCHSVSPPLSKGGNPHSENFKKGGNLKKNLGCGKPKGGERFSKIKGGTQLFKLNLGREKNKNEDF